MTAVQIKIEFF